MTVSPKSKNSNCRSAVASKESLPSKTELMFEIRQDSFDDESGEEHKVSKVKIMEAKNTTFRDVASV